MPPIVVSCDVLVWCSSARAHGLDACAFQTRLTERDGNAAVQVHAVFINQGPQVAHAPWQRTEAVDTIHSLGSGECWPSHVRILMSLLASPWLGLAVPTVNTCSTTIIT